MCHHWLDVICFHKSPFNHADLKMDVIVPIYTSFWNILHHSQEQFLANVIIIMKFNAFT